MAKAPSRHELALFTRQLATLVATGMPVQKSLDVLSRQHVDSPLALPLISVRRAVDTGFKLANALARESHVFDPMYVALVAAGETQGDLDGSLSHLADYLERDAVLRDRVKSALTYPLLVLAVTLVLTWWIFSFVLPSFLPMFHALKGGVPLATRLMMGMVTVCTSPWIALPLATALVGAGMLIRQYLEQPQGREMRDRMALRLPLIGGLTRKVVLARIARGMATMVGSGLPILEVLQQTGRSCGHVEFQENLARARSSLMQGMSLSQHFAASEGLYPAMFVQMVKSGEETGHMEALMRKSADAYDIDVSYTIETLLTVLEPLLMTVLAVIVGFIVIAVFLPLYGFLTQLG